MSATSSKTKKSFRFIFRLYATYAILILVAGSAFSYLFYQQFIEDTYSDFKDQMRSIAISVGELILIKPESSFDQTLQKSVGSLDHDIQIRLFSATSGDLIASSNLNPDLQLSIDTEELAQVLGKGQHHRGFEIASFPEKPLSYSRLINKSTGDPLLVIQINQSATEIGHRASDLRRSLFLSLLTAMMTASVLGFFLDRLVFGQLRTLTNVAKAYSTGDFTKKSPLLLDPNINKLGHALNALADMLQQQIDSVRQEHNRLRVILGGMKDGIIAIDNEEKIVLVNPVAARLLDIEQRTSRNRKIIEVTHNRTVHDLLIQTLRTQKPAETKLQIIAPIGERSIIAYTSPLMDAAQKTSGALVVFHDVTEIERLEIVRQDFVANVSHELKTPITAIRGFAETLEDDPATPEKTRRRFISKITKQSHRLSLLVSDLLVLARLEEVTAPSKYVPLDLRGIIQERIRSFSHLESPHIQTRIISDVGSTPLMVLGEEEELRQVVGNLIDNALKYTESDGEIHVTAKVHENTALIEVVDSGLGIGTEHLERIFERFYRVDKARSREVGGTGLGLAIVKHICQNHGGDVTVESTEGIGSKFQIQLPLLCSEINSEVSESLSRS
ncbi:MAG: ATP-binding protein [Planctomycetota bacterium]